MSLENTEDIICKKGSLEKLSPEKIDKAAASLAALVFQDCSTPEQTS